MKTGVSILNKAQVRNSDFHYNRSIASILVSSGLNGQAKISSICPSHPSWLLLRPVLLGSPQPAQRSGENCATVYTVVTAVTGYEFVVVAAIAQGGDHL